MAFDFTRRNTRQRIASLFALQLTCLIGGCSLAPAWETPPAAVPATLGSLTAAPGENAVPPGATLTGEEQRFLKAFAPDRDLVPLIERVLAHNADYRLALLQVDRARAESGIARAARLPALGMQMQGRKQHFDNPELQERYQQNVFSTGLGVDSFELDFFGRLKSLSDAARQRYLAAEAGREAVRGALIAEALRTYVLLGAAAEASGRYASIDADNAALFAIAQRQAAAGLIARDDLDNCRARAERAHAAALRAADDVRAAQRALQMLAGYDAVQAPATLAPLAGISPWSSALRDLGSQVLLQRPDVRQAEADLRAAHADIGAARAAFFPSIQLSTSLGSASGSLNGLFGAGSGVWSFVPQLTLPVFDFGQRRANLDLAWTRRQGGVVEYERVIESAFREVANALDAQATLTETEARLREQARRDAARVERATARSAQGLLDRPALLADRIGASQTALEHIDAQQSLVLNRIALFHAFYGVALPSD